MIKNKMKLIITIISYIFISIALIVIFGLSYLFIYDRYSEKETTQSDQSNVVASSTNEIIINEIVTETPKKESDKYFCEDGSNVSWTECIIENLDRASAEREWKQRKIESIKEFQINKSSMYTDLSTEIVKVRKWRENFEQSRDVWCEARISFVSGSGTPGAIAECKLNIELSAIKDLDSLHYSIVDFGMLRSGIPDFDPTEKDIDKLIKTNKTNRGCVWLGEGGCN